MSGAAKAVAIVGVWIAIVVLAVVTKDAGFSLLAMVAGLIGTVIIVNAKRQ